MTRPSRRDSVIGSVIGDRYEVVRKIATGGMGTIYEAEHRRLGRSFAIKTLSRELADDDEALARFRREADVIAKLRHPHIVDIVDSEVTGAGRPCIVMELLSGEDLGARIRRSIQLPWSEIAQLGDEVLSALEAAHRAGITHRDLKPKNIFLTRDDSGGVRAKLLDFGVSKIRHSTTLVTTDTSLLGTPSYMSPEQADGRHDEIGPASDVWAVGAILYEMAAGKQAFAAPSVPSILYRICYKDPEPLSAHRDDVPDAFATVVSRALSRDPARRITTASALRDALRDALAPDAAGDATPALATPRPPGVPATAIRATAPGPASESPEPAQETVRATSTSIRPLARSRTRIALAAGVIAAAGAVAAAAGIASGGRASEATGGARAAGTPTGAGDAAGARAPTRAAAGAADRPGGPAAPATAGSPDAASREVRVTITSAPSGARLVTARGGALRCTTPCTFSRERGAAAERFVLRRPGHRDRRLTLRYRRDDERHVELAREPDPPAAARDEARRERARRANAKRERARRANANRERVRRDRQADKRGSGREPTTTDDPGAVRDSLGDETVNPFE